MFSPIISRNRSWTMYRMEKVSSFSRAASLFLSQLKKEFGIEQANLSKEMVKRTSVKRFMDFHIVACRYPYHFCE